MDPRPSDAAQPLVKPGDYSVMLFDCTFDSPGSHGDRFHRVLDASGKTVCVGNTAEQACWLAKKIRSAEMLAPSNFESSLSGCVFGAQTRGPDVVRTVLQPLPGGIGNRVIGCGRDRASSARAGAHTLLRERPLEKLSADEFSKICNVVTVEIMRGKSGKATTGPTWLKPDAGVSLSAGSGFRDLRNAIQAECEHLRVPQAEATKWCEDRLTHIMEAPLKEYGWYHFPLAQNQHILLRTRDSAPASICIREAFVQMLGAPAPAEVARVKAPASHEAPGVSEAANEAVRAPMRHRSA